MVLLAHKYKLDSVCNADVMPLSGYLSTGIPKGIRTKINYMDSLAQYIDLVKFINTICSIFLVFLRLLSFHKLTVGTVILSASKKAVNRFLN